MRAYHYKPIFINPYLQIHKITLIATTECFYLLNSWTCLLFSFHFFWSISLSLSIFSSQPVLFLAFSISHVILFPLFRIRSNSLVSTKNQLITSLTAFVNHSLVLYLPLSLFSFLLRKETCYSYSNNLTSSDYHLFFVLHSSFDLINTKRQHLLNSVCFSFCFFISRKLCLSPNPLLSVRLNISSLSCWLPCHPMSCLLPLGTCSLYYIYIFAYLSNEITPLVCSSWQN